MSYRKQVFLTELDQFYEDDIEGIGIIRFEGAKVYKWVKFISDIAATADRLMFLPFNATIETEVTNLRLLTPVIAGMNPADGIAENTFCWIQTRGLAYSDQALNGSPSDGDALTMEYTVGTLPRFEVKNAVTQPTYAFAYDVSAKLVFLTCPF
jgi:hypothetical protein